MAEYDYESDFDQIPCEFCEELFPFELVIEHQTGCRPELFQVEPSIEEIEARFNSEVREETKEESSVKDDYSIDFITESSEPRTQSISKEKTIPNKEQETNTKEKKENKESFKEHEIIEDKKLQEGTETFSFGSSNRGKRMEEERPSFRIPPIPILGNSENKHPFQNDLTESDNEEGETLEEFWKKANIKLASKLKALEKKNSDRFSQPI